MDVRKKFGICVRELRIKKDLTQEQLALKSGLDRTYIPSIERGERKVSIVTVEKLAKALGVEIGELFKLPK